MKSIELKKSTFSIDFIKNVFKNEFIKVKKDIVKNDNVLFVDFGYKKINLINVVTYVPMSIEIPFIEKTVVIDGNILPIHGMYFI